MACCRSAAFLQEFEHSIFSRLRVPKFEETKHAKTSRGLDKATDWSETDHQDSGDNILSYLHLFSNNAGLLSA